MDTLTDANGFYSTSALLTVQTCCNSQCDSVCLSITFWCFVQTNEDAVFSIR